ncbi:MAG: hypothetical protein M3Y58_21270 [Chloroflexota bacterium]|nr:hypothetical protein [Chloroflexota bacterium]
MALRNRTGPSGRTLLLSGLICLIAGIGIVVMRLHTPTPGIVILAVIGIVAGFTLTSTGILALFSRPVWIEGTVVDARWTISGMRRTGTAVLDIGEADLLTIHLDYAVYRALTVGDRVRVEHNSLNRAQVYQMEIISHVQPGAKRL